WIDGEGNVDCFSVFRNTARFVVVSTLTTSQASQNVVLLIAQFRRNNHGDRPADHLLFRITKYPMGSAVPRCNNAIQVLGNDCIIQGVPNSRVVQLNLLRVLEIGSFRLVHQSFVSLLSIPTFAEL